MNRKTSSVFLFLIGMFSHTQIYIGGAIGISELFVFALAPFIFLQDYGTLKRDGFLPLVYLILLSLIGCVISCAVNGTAFAYESRGLMANYGFFACVIVFHRLLRNNLTGVRWFLLGVAISFVISTFVFHGATELAQYGGNDVKHATTGIVSSPLFWATRLGSFWVLPYSGWYMTTPQVWNYLSPAIWGVVFLFFSQGSGRSGALTMFAASVVLLACGKSQQRIRRVSRNIGIYLLIGIPFLFAFTTLYRNFARSGILGANAQVKYERQVKGKRSPLQILMAGRGEFFVGLTACLNRPLVGYGPWAIDKDGIYEEWLNKYGDQEDLENYYKYLEYVRKSSGISQYHLIPAHSVIISFWLSYGIMGFVLWVYILYRIWYYLRHDMDAVPHLLGYLAGWIPMYLWNIFFSPFGGRLEYGAFLSALLLCSAVKKGVILLPDRMIRDIVRANNGGGGRPGHV